MNKIPKWIWIFGIIILIVIISASLDSNSKNLEDKNINNNHYEESEDEIEEEGVEKTLENYPVIKEQMDSIISELKESEWYTLINLAFVSGGEDYEEGGSIGVTYYMNYHYDANNSQLSFFFKNNKLNSIYYWYGNDGAKVYNRKLYLTYLSSINITENSFDNSNVNHKWDTYINILSGLNCDTWATTVNNIRFSCSDYSFSINFD